MRIPLATTLESRDGTVDQDAIVKNCIVEAKGDQTKVRKRPALSSYGLIRVGVAQALGYWDGGIVSVVDDYFGYGVPGIYTHSTTWNSADKTADVTLSGSDLVAQTNTAGSAGGVRSVLGVSSGLWYFEATVNDFDDVYFGLATSAKTLTESPGAAGTSCVTYHRSGAIQYGNTTIATGASFGNSVVIALLLDADNRTLKFYRANVLQGTCTTSQFPTGTLYAYFGSAAGNGTSQITANFGATAFTYTVPGLTTNALSPTTADLQFSMQESGANSPGGNLLMIKNREQAWVVNNAGTVAAITDVDYPGTYAVTLTGLTRSSTTATATTPTDTNFQIGGSVTIAGVNEAGWNGAYTITGITPSVTITADSIPITITRSSTTATATCTSTPHGFTTGATVTISGADQAEYNGAKSITVTSTTAFTFTVTVTGSAFVTPATGTITYFVNTQQIRAMTVSSSVATLTTYEPHGLATGKTINAFLFYRTSAGAQNLTYTGVAVTRVSDTVFTIPATAAPDGSAVGGESLSSFYYGLDGFAITSITSDGVTATVTTTATHYLGSGARVHINGAGQFYYNYIGQVTPTGAATFTFPVVGGPSIAASPISPATGTITAVSGSGSVVGSSFTFTVDGTETTPATGTITATGGRNTVPGIAYVDGYFNVMDIYGVIYSSKEDAPSTWDALEYTSAQLETGAGVALTRSQNYLVAFKEWSSEFFYNARNPVGSPFSPVDNGFTQTGCASGDSVASVDGAILFMSQARQKGRSVHVMQGITQEKVSTPDVERVLNADDLATVRAYGMKLDGHSLYLLTLGTSNITLVYDLSSGIWSQWSSLTIGSSKSVSSITRSGTTATVTCGVAHTLSDGDPVKISGASQSDYNGIFQISYVDSTSFKIEVANSPTTPATGTILAYPYTESYFKFTHYTNADGTDLVLHESNGYLYSVSSSVYQDDGVPVNMFIRTQRLDGGDSALKKMARVRLIGEKVSDTAMIRWSDDDSATFSAYRTITLSNQQPELRRCGAFRRRSMEFRHVGNTAPRADSLEMDMGS